MMKLGVIGSGIVGKVLAAGFSKAGYTVMIGTGNPNKLEDWQQSDAREVLIGSFAETAAFSDVAILAVKGTVALEAVRKAGVDNLQGKIVIDANNPIADEPPVNGVLKFFTGPNDSLMEHLQNEFPAIRFVKAFSCVGNALMIQPDLGGAIPTMFICGNDPEAKREVTQMLKNIGWQTEDMGLVESARAIEPLCILWCIPGMLHGQWNHAFKLLRR